jgi:SAM-dependent methyltransferase
MEETIKFIPENADTILDVGCGSGAILNELRNRNKVGIDFSRTALSQVKAERILGDVGRLPFVSDCFDVIVSTEVIEHLDDLTFHLFIKEINRLRPKIIVMTAPYEEDLDAMLSQCKKCGWTFNIFHHRRSVSPDIVDNLFPNYRRTDLKLLNEKYDASKWITILGHRLGYYAFKSGEICDKCGSKIEKPLRIVSITFGGLRLISTLPARMRKRTHPHHMVLRYEMIRNPHLPEMPS